MIGLKDHRKLKEKRRIYLQMYTIISILRQKVGLKNGRDGIKRSIQPCFHNGPPRGVNERKVFTKEQKRQCLLLKS